MKVGKRVEDENVDGEGKLVGAGLVGTKKQKKKEVWSMRKVHVHTIWRSLGRGSRGAENKGPPRGG